MTLTAGSAPPLLSPKDPLEDRIDLPLLHGGQRLILLELLAPHDDIDALLTETSDGHGCNPLCDLGTLVGMESIGILVGLGLLLCVTLTGRRLVGFVYSRHYETVGVIVGLFGPELCVVCS